MQPLELCQDLIACAHRRPYHIPVAAQPRRRRSAVPLHRFNPKAWDDACRPSVAGTVTGARTRQRLGFLIVSRGLGTNLEALVVVDRLRLHGIGSAGERLNRLAVDDTAIEI